MIPRPASGRRKELTWVRIRCGPLYAVEAEVGRLVAIVTCSREGVVGDRECFSVLLVDSRAQVRQRLGDHPRDCILWRDRRVLVRGMKLDDVVEAFAELVDFIGRQAPVFGLPGEPELDV